MGQYHIVNCYSKAIAYMHWREERLLIPPLHELPILRRYLSFISYRVWGIVSERSLLAVVNEKISLLQILLKANWHNFTLCQLLKLCWEREETKFGEIRSEERRVGKECRSRW